MADIEYVANNQAHEIQPRNDVGKARAELLAALSEFDTTAGKLPVTRLANAIEDVISARLAAMR